jgi:ribose 5-phosphate isomerase A
MEEQNTAQDSWKQMAGAASVQFIEDNMVLGLGSGSTSTFMVYALAERIKQGLHIVGAIASSQEIQDLASRLGIPLTDLDTYAELDLYIDGADEIDPQLNLLKGGGGALVREKIVATAARRFIVIADINKQVERLITRFPLPVEVVPFATSPVRKRLEKLGAIVTLRQKAGSTYITDNHNIILDCAFPQGVADPYTLNEQIKHIVGVVETGLFLDIAERALIGGPDGVKTLVR